MTNYKESLENVIEQLKTTAIENEEFTYEGLLQMQGIEDTGVKIKGYLIPCYNSQNGYSTGGYYLGFDSGFPVRCVRDIKEKK